MATWNEFAAAAPEMATAGRVLWEDHVLMFLATVRADGSPRVHPVVPVLVDGRVLVAISDRSPKWRDLAREPRAVLHAMPGPRDDEFVLRVEARDGEARRTALAEAADHVIHDDDHIVELDIVTVDHGWWEHVGQPGTYHLRRRWTPTGVVDIRGPRPAS